MYTAQEGAAITMCVAVDDRSLVEHNTGAATPGARYPHGRAQSRHQCHSPTFFWICGCKKL